VDAGGTPAAGHRLSGGRQRSGGEESREVFMPGPFGLLGAPTLLLLVAAAVVIVLAARGGRGGAGRPGAAEALEILDRRLVAGQIDPADHQRRRDLLAAAGNRPTGVRRTGLLIGLLLLVLVLALPTVGFVGGFWAQPAWRHGPSGYAAVAVRCPAPANLPGRVVGITLFDMVGRPSLGGPGGQMPGGSMAGPGGTPMMGIAPAVTSVPAGQVTLVATDGGLMTHELLVLPLAGSARAGSRPVGADGTVEETGRLGEVSNSCAAGSGGGLRPGTAGWTTLTLPAGRYELLCNLPGHYAAGMYAELTVS